MSLTRGGRAGLIAGGTARDRHPQSDPDAPFPGYEYQGQRGGEVLSVTVTTGVGQDPGCESKPHHNASTSIIGVGLTYPDHLGQPAQVEPTRTPVPTSATAWADSTFGRFNPVTGAARVPRRRRSVRDTGPDR